MRIPSRHVSILFEVDEIEISKNEPKSIRRNIQAIWLGHKVFLINSLARPIDFSKIKFIATLGRDKMDNKTKKFFKNNCPKEKQTPNYQKQERDRLMGGMARKFTLGLTFKDLENEHQ